MSKGGRPISKDEHEARMKLWERGLNDNEMALRRGISPTSIWKWRKDHNLSANERACPDSCRKTQKDFLKKSYFTKPVRFYNANPGKVGKIVNKNERWR